MATSSPEAFGKGSPSSHGSATPPDVGATISMSSSIPTAATPTKISAVPNSSPSSDATSDGSAKASVNLLKHVFRRHVRPKKQHEIQLLGEVSKSEHVH